MSKKYKIAYLFTAVAGLIALTVWYLSKHTVAVLQPRGAIGEREYQLMIMLLFLSLIVVVPVFIMLFAFSWRYREGNKKAKYSPEFDHSRILETIWWLVPASLILVLSVIIWRTSYELDPYKPIASATKPLTIQVVAMEWKWLFIYPEQGIASVNYLEIPEKTPITFHITADAPMNSFWIPQLGGQMYAMPGMITRLNLVADQTGTYIGSSANISGRGFSDMNFKAAAKSETDFQKWAINTKINSLPLDSKSYAALAKPAIQKKPSTYNLAQDGLYYGVVMKYMHNHSTSSIDSSSLRNEKPKAEKPFMPSSHESMDHSSIHDMMEMHQ